MATLSDLTRREIEILQLVLSGWTQKFLLQNLCLRKKLVDFHVDKIYTKIGVETRLMAGVSVM